PRGACPLRASNRSCPRRALRRAAPAAALASWLSLQAGYGDVQRENVHGWLAQESGIPVLDVSFDATPNVVFWQISRRGDSRNLQQRVFGVDVGVETRG